MKTTLPPSERAHIETLAMNPPQYRAWSSWPVKWLGDKRRTRAEAEKDADDYNKRRENEKAAGACR